MHIGREKLDAIRYQADRHWEERKYRMDDTFNVEFKRTTQWVEVKRTKGLLQTLSVTLPDQSCNLLQSNEISI